MLLYISLKSRASRVALARLRFSSHDLRIERGRYSTNPANPSSRACSFCCNINHLKGFEALPFAETPILETEEHLLNECPTYHTARSSLSDPLKSLLMLKEYLLIMQSDHVTEFGLYLVACHRIRNPR